MEESGSEAGVGRQPTNRVLSIRGPLRVPGAGCLWGRSEAMPNTHCRVTQQQGVGAGYLYPNSLEFRATTRVGAGLVE